MIISLKYYVCGIITTGKANFAKKKILGHMPDGIQ